MKKAIFAVVLATVAWTAATRPAEAHCQMPCGIYNDQLRVDLIKEHADTIAKAMRMITDLSKETPVNYNQVVRWVDTKEHHANEIQEIVSDYFMTQRIAPGDTAYAEKIKALHELLIAAMKCKQTVDPANVQKVRDALNDFEKLYFRAHKTPAKSSKSLPKKK